MNKVVRNLKEAVRAVGLRDGMTISFHHCLRAGDTIGMDIVRAVAECGIRDIHLAPSALQTGHDDLVDYMKDGTIRKISSSTFTRTTGEAVQMGLLKEVADMRTHGTRPRDIENGTLPIDVAFIAVSACDKWGNCNGVQGKSAFGSLGYAMLDARYAKKVVVVTDNLQDTPVWPVSIDQSLVDVVVPVDSIGDPAGIASNTLKITKDPVYLKIADMTANLIKASGYLYDGCGMQTGAGGISLAVAARLEQYMTQQHIAADFAMGGIHGTLCRMMKQGLIRTLYDVQCFDRESVKSLGEDRSHVEVSGSAYANPDVRGGPIVDNLDFVILGATEIDVNFNVNVHTDSNYHLMSGAGGHGDTAEGAKMTIITAPAFRSRVPTILDRVSTISTPGKCIDVFVCQRGIAVNTDIERNRELVYRLKDAGIPTMDIHDMKAGIEKTVGVPNRVKHGDRTVARVLWRDGTVLDEIKSLN